MPENIFEILFNRTLIAAENTPWTDDHTKEAKNRIYQLLWEIIEAKCERKGPVKQWTPGMVHYPALIVQVLRSRFPSSEPEPFLSDCVKYDMKDFVKYRSS